jgi:ferredoxin
MRIALDRRRCEGTGFCAAVAPELFTLDGPPPVVLASEEVPPGAEEAAREAELMCPTAAISVDP